MRKLPVLIEIPVAFATACHAGQEMRLHFSHSTITDDPAVGGVCVLVATPLTLGTPPGTPDEVEEPGE